MFQCFAVRKNLLMNDGLSTCDIIITKKTTVSAIANIPSFAYIAPEKYTLSANISSMLCGEYVCM